MHLRRLRTQFLLAASLLVAAAVGCAFATHSVIVAVISGAVLLLTLIVLICLVRSVLRLIRDLTAALDALRQGEFDRRVHVSGTEEVAQLADGFNRLAENLAEKRRSTLGELLAAKQTLEATLNALPDSVIVLDPTGAVAAMNPPARTFLTAAGCLTAGRLDELPFSAAQRDAVLAALKGRQSAPERTAFNGALTVSLHGAARKLLLAVAPIPDFLPRRYGAVVVLDDVTAFARLDELRTELIAVVSHELKTPLTTLSMNLMLLSEWAENLTAAQRDIVAAAVVSCEELSETIDELLDLTRIEAGQLRLERSSVHLPALIAQAVQALRPRFDDSEITLSLVVDGPTTVLSGDASRLRIVIMNILTNALKYAPRKSMVAVQVSSGQNTEVSPRSVVQIAVTDSGPGVPAEYRERIFEKFFRVEHEQSNGRRMTKGAGVGLYLCRQIVEAHGGAIRCESAANGVGTRIAIDLPTEASAGEQPQTPSAS